MAETDSEQGEATGEGGLSERTKLGATVATVGIITSGLVLTFLTQLGAPQVGTAAFVAGFAVTIGALWYLLLRPLDFGEE